MMSLMDKFVTKLSQLKGLKSKDHMPPLSNMGNKIH